MEAIATLHNYEQLRRFVFPRGFLLTNAGLPLAEKMPTLDNWSHHSLGQYKIFCHPETKLFKLASNTRTIFLIGHAYNPWTGIGNETEILQEAIGQLGVSRERFLGYVSQLSGRFVLGVIAKEESFVLTDCAGLRSLYYFSDGPSIYLASHARLIADICGLRPSPHMTRLIRSSFYKIGIRHLPGIRSLYDGVRLLTANTLLKFQPDRVEVGRFFPRDSFSDLELPRAVEQISEVLRKSIKLLLRKAPLAISLTGGVDSRLTLAASRDVSDDIVYFSYASTEAERQDADFASTLADALGLSYRVFEIPSNGGLSASSDFKTIFEYNTAGFRQVSEYRKAEVMAEHWPPGTIEVKSVVSEIGRKFYTKRLGRELPRKLTPRHMSNLYKRNMFDRRTLEYMDECFKEFIQVTRFGADDFSYNQADLFYWEHRLSAWQSLVLHDADYSRDTTSIFNNRQLQQYFLAVDDAFRIDDRLQMDIIRTLWPETLDPGILTNTGGSGIRAKARQVAERVFFLANSI